MRRIANSPGLVGFSCALLVIMTACNNGGGSSDNTRPTVIATSPGDGTIRVLTNAGVSATFSEAMDSSTITANSFTVSYNPPVDGSVAYDPATRTANFTPVSDLPPGRVFTATLNTDVRDQAGAAMAADTSWTFTSEESMYRVSVDSSGGEGNAESRDCEHCSPISGDGRYIAFTSEATNLVSGDTNGVTDAFRHDWQTGSTIRVSVPNAADQGTLGAEADDGASEPSISVDGRYVAFYSGATNLVLSDTNGSADIFVHDTQTSQTTRASIPNAADQTTLGTQANSSSFRAELSADGRLVVFYSLASNLVTGDTNGVSDVFVHDRQTDVTERVSVDTAGNQATGTSQNPSISADGRYVAFESSADDLVASDTNSSNDIFVHDRQTGVTERVSVDSSGNQAGISSGSAGSNPSLSADGRHVVFWGSANELVASDTNNESDVFVHDRQTGETSRVSIPNGPDQGTLGVESNSENQYPSISGDGRYVAFASDATNLVTGDTNGHYDVFVHDRQMGTTRRVSLHPDGTQGDNYTSDWASISADGRYVLFYSFATTLIESDTNAFPDVFRALNATVP